MRRRPPGSDSARHRYKRWHRASCVTWPFLPNVQTSATRLLPTPEAMAGPLYDGEHRG